MKVPISFEGIPGEDISSDDNEVSLDCTDDTFENRCAVTSTTVEFATVLTCQAEQVLTLLVKGRIRR